MKSPNSTQAWATDRSMPATAAGGALAGGAAVAAARDCAAARSRRTCTSRSLRTRMRSGSTCRAIRSGSRPLSAKRPNTPCCHAKSATFTSSSRRKASFIDRWPDAARGRAPRVPRGPDYVRSTRSNSLPRRRAHTGSASPPETSTAGSRPRRRANRSTTPLDESGLRIENAGRDRVVRIVGKLDGRAVRLRQARGPVRQCVQHQSLSRCNATADEASLPAARLDAIDRRRGSGGHEHERALRYALARPEHAVPAIGSQLRRAAIAVEQYELSGIARLGPQPLDARAALGCRCLDRAPGRDRCHAAAERRHATRQIAPGRTEARGEIVRVVVVFDRHRARRPGRRLSTSTSMRCCRCRSAASCLRICPSQRDIADVDRTQFRSRWPARVGRSYRPRRRDPWQ